MGVEYKVAAFVPQIKGCGAQDQGWDQMRCSQFESFLNERSTAGWKLHSSEYRAVKAAVGCGTTTGAQLICIFERQK